MNKHRWLVVLFGVCVLLSLTATFVMAQGPGGGQPIKSVTAGTGLTGGGTSGDVTLAITPTYRLPQACTNGKIAKWNGTAWACAADNDHTYTAGTGLALNGSQFNLASAFQLPQACANGQIAKWNETSWTCANDGLTLPLIQTFSDLYYSIAITNTGTGGGARFITDNSSNSTYPALHASTYGMNSTVLFGNMNPANEKDTLQVSTRGIGRAGWFNINNISNNSPALQVTTIGTGQAGKFQITNSNNTSTALEVSTNGTGDALSVTGVGRFYQPNPAIGFALTAVSNSSSFPTFYAKNTGVAGYAARIEITNPASYSSTLRVYNFGQGEAISAGVSGSGHGSGSFYITNSANPSSALSANTIGTGWAGYFEGRGTDSKGVYISTAGAPALEVVGGTKNAVVATNNGARLLYTEESSQVWFTDYGFGHLQNGRTTVAIDPLFSQTINLDEPYHVFVQAYGDTELYVTNRTRTGFEVRARDGDQTVEFSYRLVAKRLGFEDKRLEHATWADTDPNLYSGK